MRDPAQHLKSLADAYDHLQAFLHAGQAFWTRGNLPSLSLGAVYWDRLALSALRGELDPPSRRQFDELALQIDRLADRWKVAWEQKSVVEARARLNLWRAYLADLAERQGEGQSYPTEVRNRLLAGYLIEQAGRQSEVDPLRSQLETHDARLRAQFQPGEFVWDAMLKRVLPQADHWYLYGRPRRPS